MHVKGSQTQPGGWHAELFCKSTKLNERIWELEDFITICPSGRFVFCKISIKLCKEMYDKRVIVMMLNFTGRIPIYLIVNRYFVRFK